MIPDDMIDLHDRPSLAVERDWDAAIGQYARDVCRLNADNITAVTVRDWTAEDWCELFERAPEVATLVRSQISEPDAIKYQALLASATGKTENLSRLLDSYSIQHYITRSEIERAEPDSAVVLAAHVLVSERHGKFELIHLVAYLLAQRIAK